MRVIRCLCDTITISQHLDLKFLNLNTFLLFAPFFIIRAILIRAIFIRAIFNSRHFFFAAAVVTARTADLQAFNPPRMEHRVITFGKNFK